MKDAQDAETEREREYVSLKAPQMVTCWQTRLREIEKKGLRPETIALPPARRWLGTGNKKGLLR
jgi:hypothetical protein